ncbi:MAG: hypothetical protein AB8H80_23730 [Planctomycetota bacterium]
MSRLRTIFISTRTDECALERRAAYEAAVSQGLVPFTYDASIHRLSTLTVPQVAPPSSGEVRQTKRRATWDHIATLIDQSDYFVGVYDRTLGAPDRPANNMPWLRFELLRFLAVQLQQAQQLRAYGMRTPNEALRQADRFEQALRDQLVRPQPNEACNALHDILANRMFLYQRLENDGDDDSYEERAESDGRPRSEPPLAALLDPFWQFVRGFKDQVQRLQANTPGQASELLPVRAAHALLFRKLSEGLRDLHYDPSAAKSEQTRPRILEFELSGGGLSKRPGGLYVFLRTLFQRGLGVQSLWVGDHGKGNDLAPMRGTIVGMHHGGFAVAHAAAEAKHVTALVEAALPGVSLNIHAAPPDAAHLSERSLQLQAGEFRHLQAQVHSDVLTYRIEVAWMPGVLWAIVAVATAFDANIVHMSTNPRSERTEEGRKVGFELGRIVEVELSVEAMPDVKWWNASEFEYQLKSLHGYVSASVLRGTR